MGIFNLFSGRSGKSKTVYGKNAGRTFAPYQRRPNPDSNRSRGNTSRFKRF
jgi:hypothetical protein